jgi:hypothetical protein
MIYLFSPAIALYCHISPNTPTKCTEFDVFFSDFRFRMYVENVCMYVLYIYLCCIERRYSTPRAFRNEVVVWDAIVTNPADAVLKVRGAQWEYPLRDQGHGLRRRNVTCVCFFFGLWHLTAWPRTGSLGVSLMPVMVIMALWLGPALAFGIQHMLTIYVNINSVHTFFLKKKLQSGITLGGTPTRWRGSLRLAARLAGRLRCPTSTQSDSLSRFTIKK